MEKYNSLRMKYPTFTFDNYSINETNENIEVEYTFNIENLAEFKPTWKFPKSKTVGIDDSVLEKLIFSLGMVELVSYWKISCAPNVIVKCGKLDNEQIEWWKKQYFYGLGEFFYTNGIDADYNDFMSMISVGNDIEENRTSVNLDGALIPIGGGKDSAVTIEVLKSMKEKTACYIINPRGATLDTAEIGGFSGDSLIKVGRTLDKNMLELNKQGFLNGHTPFSAIVAFSAVITAYLSGKKYVVLSNEASANESTVSDSYVNHQYSKSFQFEKDFCDYEEQYINSGVKYFSLLRSMSEFQIAQYFAKQKAYHGIFKSCNAGSKQNIWCCNCPKCLFVYLILSPFLTSAELVNIFGENLLEKENLKTTFEQLIGICPEKPFECVGSRDEVNTAIGLTIVRMEKENEKLPYLFEYYKTLDISKSYIGKDNKYKEFYDEQNLIPAEFKKLLDDECYDGILRGKGIV